MKDILKLGIILMLYGVVAAFALAMVNSATKPIIDELARAEKENAIKEVLPAQELDPDTLKLADGSEMEYISGYDGTHKLIGYVVISNGIGFSSTIQTIIGLKPDFSINAIEIVSQNETPGLGTKCVEMKKDAKEPWFEMQFDGKEISTLKVTKNKGEDGGNIDAIAGATITSNAVTSSVRSTAMMLQENMPAPQEMNNDSLTTDTLIVTDTIKIKTAQTTKEVTNE